MLVDSTVCALSGAYLAKAFDFIIKANKNKKMHCSNPINREHFTEHLVSCATGLVGGVLSFGFSLIHFFAQNVFNLSENVLSQIEYGTDAGIIMVLVSGMMFMDHMTREETRGHPFFAKEYGEITK